MTTLEQYWKLQYYEKFQYLIYSLTHIYIIILIIN